MKAQSLGLFARPPHSNQVNLFNLEVDSSDISPNWIEMGLNVL